MSWQSVSTMSWRLTPSARAGLQPGETGPTIILRPLHQPGPNRIHFDIPGHAPKLPLIPNHPIKTLLLPKCPTPPQNSVRRPSTSPLHPPKQIDLIIRYYTERKVLPESPDNNWKIVPAAAVQELRREATGEARQNMTK